MASPVSALSFVPDGRFDIAVFVQGKPLDIVDDAVETWRDAVAVDADRAVGAGYVLSRPHHAFIRLPLR